MVRLKRCIYIIKEKYFLQIIIFFLLMSFLIISYSVIRQRIDRQGTIVEDDFSWVYQIDEVLEIKKGVIISGWIFHPERNTEKEICDVILRDIETEKLFYAKMDYLQRQDVNDYFFSEYSYVDCGFTASFKNASLNFENNVYEILIKPTGTKKIYKTNIFYSKEGLSYTNPDDFSTPNVKGTFLEEVVNKGVLRVYRPDFGIYVYQYNGELYWIAEQSYDFFDGDTYIQYHVKTNQTDKLPEHRAKKGFSSDDISFSFCKNEEVLNVSNYRVAKSAIPVSYSVTEMWTGNYIDGWRWLQHFRPYYYFD